MTKVEEIIKQYGFDSGGIYTWIDLEAMLKEYAEWYAHKCLEIAADKASTSAYYKSTNKGARYKPWNGESILKRQLKNYH